MHASVFYTTKSYVYQQCQEAVSLWLKRLMWILPQQFWDPIIQQNVVQQGRGHGMISMYLMLELAWM